MICDDKRPLVHALADGELDVVHAREIEAHIASCADCADSFAEIVGDEAEAGSPGLRMRAPAGLAERILEALPAPVTRRDVPRATPRRVRRAGGVQPDAQPSNSWDAARARRARRAASVLSRLPPASPSS